MGKSALVILHEGVEEMEAIAPIDILRRGGVSVTVASANNAPQVTGRGQISLGVDAPLNDVKDSPFDCIVLPGGPGINDNVRGNKTVGDLLRKQFESGQLVAAICAAPLVLHDQGILNNKRYTAFPATRNELPHIEDNQPVVTDGNLITSAGAGTATAFALSILAALTSIEESNAIAQSICLSQPQ